MFKSSSDRIQLALVVAMVAAGAVAWFALPAGAAVAIHFDGQGVANGWAGPVGLFVMPALAAGSWGLQSLLPKIDPRGANLVRSARAVGTIFVAVAALLATVQGLIVAATFGVQPKPDWLLGPAGGLLAVLGNVMGKLRWNYSVGIRTPWTLADERVWDKTHRWGGKLMVCAGLLLIALAFAPPTGFAPGAVIATVVGASALLSVLKSYWLWHQMQHTPAP